MQESMSMKVGYVHNMENKNLHRGKGRYKKKDGFTLIEVIAVIAIIGIMASVLLPKFTNYINEAKKLKVVEQSRKVVMAVECYNMKANTTSSKISNDATVTTAMAESGVRKYFENPTLDIDKLDGGMKISDCYNIVNGAEFDLDPDHDYKYRVETSASSESSGQTQEQQQGGGGH